MSQETIGSFEAQQAGTLARDRLWVDEALAQAEARLARYFDERAAAAYAYGPDYGKLWQSTRQASFGGKRVRPRLVLTAYRGHGGSDSAAAKTAVLSVAVSYELLHTAFLLHDDIIDGDIVRRGHPNVAGAFRRDALDRGASTKSAHRWGEAGAILAGDLLLHDATSMMGRAETDVLVRTRLLDILDRDVYVTAAGELADVSLAERLGPATPALEDVLAMNEWKTAAYSVSGPLMSGAVLAGADEDAVAVLADFGRLVGIAFQLGDDLLGVFGSEATTGKSVISDLREGKETSLIAFARRTSHWGKIAPSLGRDDLTAEGARHIAGVLEECGARGFVEALLAQHVDLAIAGLGSPSIPSRLADTLAAVARSCVGRIV